MASHHFLLEAVLRIQVDKSHGSRKYGNRYNIAALKDPFIRSNFANRFAAIAEMQGGSCNLLGDVVNCCLSVELAVEGFVAWACGIVVLNCDGVD